MESYLNFKPEETVLKGSLRLIVTKTPFADISPYEDAAINILSVLSQQKNIIIMNGEKDGTYSVYFHGGCLLCRIEGDRRGLLVVAYRPHDLEGQNRAMKYGVCFTVNEGIIILINWKHPHIQIKNGTVSNNEDYRDVGDTLSVIENTMRMVRESKYDEILEDTDAIYQPERKFARLLEKAEKYAMLSNEVEEKNAMMLGNVPYERIASVAYNERIDRVAYEFIVGGVDDKIFRVGVQVEIEDKEQETHTAEIIKVNHRKAFDETSPIRSLILLFNSHIDIQKFENSGWFRLSISSVNMDVQLDAIEKLRTNQARAKYMDDVFGRNETKGFESIDLLQLERSLRNRQYPLNDSQVSAVLAGIESKDVFLVMGPPGTGKTTVILEWVKYFIKSEHKRVLVSSQNNKAVDNVLARIADEPGIDTIRIGSEAKIQQEVTPYLFENKVAGLRMNIEQSCFENLKIIDELLSEWERFYGDVLILKRKYDTVKEKKKSVIETIRADLMPYFQRMEEVFSDYQLVYDKRRQLNDEILSIYDSIRTVEDSKGIIHFFKSFGYKKKLDLMEEKTHEFCRLVEQEKVLARSYNTARAKFTSQYELIRDTDFEDYYYELYDLETLKKKEFIKPDTNTVDIWGLFSAIGQIDLEEDNINYLTSKIETAISTANDLKHTLEEWKNSICSKQNYALNQIVLETVDLVGATCIGINSQKRFAGLEFDVTIIDEAGQIQVQNALVPMSVSNKVIMLGDHKQIPPNVSEEMIDLCFANGVNPDLLETSLFERMYGELPEENKVMLNTQWRMPAEIADTLSKWFYDGKYLSPPQKRGQKSLLTIFNSPYVVIDTSESQKRYETRIPGGGSRNSFEADIIVDLMDYIMSDPDIDMHEIGIISAYQAQVTAIKSKLKGFLEETSVNDMVATLDSFQGQERDIIIYSFTKSSKIPCKERRIGFLNELRRLNVALSRSKKMLIMIGDMKFLSSCEYCDHDDFGEPEYDKSEKQFSEFIQLMLNDVNDGKGEMLDYKEFQRRLLRTGTA